MTQEQIRHLAELDKELEELKLIRERWSNDNTRHFAFVEHYGPSPHRLEIPKRFNEVLFGVVDEFIKEIQEEIASA